jgi:hypothetical protein
MKSIKQDKEEMNFDKRRVAKMKDITTVEGCQLEIDRKRGVIYVHSPEGKTLVRVCKIPQFVVNTEDMMDIMFDRELAKMAKELVK